VIRDEHRSILVVDGDGRSRALVEGVLTVARYRVVSPADVATSAAGAQTELPDLVLADIASGVMEAVPRWQRRKTDREAGGPAVGEGYALLRALEADPGAPCHAVVILGTDEMWRDRPQPPRFGVVGYVPKPVAQDTLVATLREAFRAADRRGSEARRSGVPFADPDLELAPERDAAPAAERIPSGAGFEALPAPLRIALLVDAEDSFRDFLHSLLVAQGFTVYEAGNGEEGLRQALEIRPWLILTDVNMPGMDGFEFCRRVRNHSLLRQTPLVFVSEWDDYRERYHALKLGADDYISKRTPPREMLIRLQIILRRYTDVGMRTRKGAGMQGGLELIGPPGVLQMCHLGRFTGACSARSGARRIEIRFREGEIVWARSDVGYGPEAIYEFMSWTRGHFEFLPGDPGTSTPFSEGFEFLLLEGCRRLDEAGLSEGRSADDGEVARSR
jgi:DNA-binding response OmpR family regulator